MAYIIVDTMYTNKQMECWREVVCVCVKARTVWTQVSKPRSELWNTQKLKWIVLTHTVQPHAEIDTSLWTVFWTYSNKAADLLYVDTALYTAKQTKCWK